MNFIELHITSVLSYVDSCSDQIGRIFSALFLLSLQRCEKKTSVNGTFILLVKKSVMYNVHINVPDVSREQHNPT